MVVGTATEPGQSAGRARQKSVALTGNGAVAMALRQGDPDVVACYPITPQTTIVEELSGYAAKGQIKAAFVNVESEHSAMSATIGAAAAGARAVTSTSSQGLALMWEMLYIAAGLRLPIVMATANRALSAPINIHGDHSDVMGARDTGWVQLFSEDAQEAYDNTLMAYRIAEDDDVKLPVNSNLDGFIISHAIARLDVIDDLSAAGFIGEHKPTYSLLLDPEKETVGAFDGIGGFYMEFKRQQDEALLAAKDVILKIADEFEALTGRKYGFFEEYRLDDADEAIVVMGSAAGTARGTIDYLREQGRKVGMLKLRVFRPFPADEIAQALAHVKTVGVLDRAHGLSGTGGALGHEIKSALYHLDTRPTVIDYVYGLGGRDITVDHIEGVFNELAGADRSKLSPSHFGYVNVRD